MTFFLHLILGNHFFLLRPEKFIQLTKRFTGNLTVHSIIHIFVFSHFTVFSFILHLLEVKHIFYLYIHYIPQVAEIAEQMDHLGIEEALISLFLKYFRCLIFLRENYCSRSDKMEASFCSITFSCKI